MSKDEIEKLEDSSEFSTVGELLADLQKRIENGLDPNTPLCCQKTKRGDVFGRVTYAVMVPVQDFEAKHIEVTAFDCEHIGEKGFVTFFAFMFF